MEKDKSSRKNKEEKLIRIGAVHYPPFYDFSAPEKRGFIQVELEKKLKGFFKIKWVRIPLARGGFALNNKLIEAYGSYSSHPDNKRELIYSKSILHTNNPLICTNRPGLSMQLGPDFYNKVTIYPQGGFIHKDVIKYKLKLHRLDYSGDYIERSLKMTKLHRADYFILPEDIRIKPYLKNQLIRCTDIAEPLHMRLSFPTDSELKNEIDDIL